jgi:hypothetical protein
MAGRPKKYERVEDMEKAINEYFNQCDINKEPYTMTGLALSLGFLDRKSLIDYCDYTDEDDVAFLHSIKRAKMICEQNVEKGLLSGKYNPTGAIFNLKNNYGWKDKQEIEQNGEMNNTITVKFSGDVEEWGK